MLITNNMKNNFKKPKRILAVDPGTRYLGIVVMEDDELIYWAVKTIKMRQSDKERLSEAKKIIQRLIDYYRPQILVIEKPRPHWSKQSKLLNRVCGIIKGTAIANGLKVREFTPEEVRKAICGNPKATKQEMAEKLILKYSDLVKFLNRDKIHNRYWHYLVDAVGLAMNKGL